MDNSTHGLPESPELHLTTLYGRGQYLASSQFDPEVARPCLVSIRVVRQSRQTNRGVAYTRASTMPGWVLGELRFEMMGMKTTTTMTTMTMTRRRMMTRTPSVMETQVSSGLQEFHVQLLLYSTNTCRYVKLP